MLYTGVLAQYATDVSRCRASCLRSYVRSRPLSSSSSMRSRKAFADAVQCRVGCVEQYDEHTGGEALVPHVWRKLAELGDDVSQSQIQLTASLLMTSGPHQSVCVL